MAKVRVLERRVLNHLWREPGAVVEVADKVARALTAADPAGFEWLDRPVVQWVEVVPPVPVAVAPVVPAPSAAADADDAILVTRKRHKRPVEAPNG